MKKALSDIGKETSISWRACASHKLQLCIQSAIKNTQSVSDILDKCTKLSQAFQNINEASRRLKAAQLERNDNVLKTKSYTVTRWNSKYDMATRLLELYPAIEQVLDTAKESQTSKDRKLYAELEPSTLSDNELLILEDILGILKPACDLTHRLSADTQSTISNEYIIIHDLINKSIDDIVTKEGRAFKEELDTALNIRWNIDDIKKQDLIAIYLNPV
ncbi:hypothetical protein BGZ76_007266, partial [Entomortierella beljakovae]